MSKENQRMEKTKNKKWIRSFIILIFIGALFYDIRLITISSLNGFPIEKQVEKIDVMVYEEGKYKEQFSTNNKEEIHLIYELFSKQNIRHSNLGLTSTFDFEKEGHYRIIITESSINEYIILFDEKKLLAKTTNRYEEFKIKSNLIQSLNELILLWQ